MPMSACHLWHNSGQFIRSQCSAPEWRVGGVTSRHSEIEHQELLRAKARLYAMFHLATVLASMPIDGDAVALVRE